MLTRCSPDARVKGDNGMASELYNVIDALSREKGIDPQIVVSAVEDAIVVATRKYYKTQETPARGAGPRERPDSRVCRQADRGHAGRGARSQRPDDHRRGPQVQSRCRSRRRVAAGEAYRRPGAHRRATGQAGHLPEGARSRARHGLQRVHRPRGRDRQRHAEARRGPGRDLRRRQSRSPHAARKSSRGWSRLPRASACGW